METYIKNEIDYLVKVLGKKLSDSCETDFRQKGHRYLAMKYWPEEFEGDEKKCVHHIDFNHSNNIVSNLVVLTYKEHKLIHSLFDPDYEEWCNNISESHKGVKLGPMTEEAKANHSIATRKSWNDERKRSQSERMSGENNPMYGKINPMTNRKHKDSSKEKMKKKQQELQVGKGTRWMNNGKDQMRVYPPWDQDMLIFGWQYGRLK